MPRTGDRREREHVSESASISTGIASRYATAVFELSQDARQIDALENDVEALAAAHEDSADLRDLIANPIYSRDEQAQAIGAIAAKMGLTETMQNVLRLMASKRRLFVLPQLLTALADRIAAHKGEVTAEVSSATELTAEQQERLKKTLSDKVGSEVKLKTTVDESLIGGMIVKVGSRMIDTSIASRLAAMQNTMKEAR